MILRPWKTLRQYKQLVAGLRLIHDHLRRLVELQTKEIDLYKNRVTVVSTEIARKDQEIIQLKADLKLLDAHLVNTVDQIHRDGVEPPQPKKYLN